MKRQKQKGFVALASVLVVGSALVVIGLSVVLSAINEAQVGLATKQKEAVTAMIESCVGDALVRINKNNTLPGTITLPTGSCTVTINSQVGTNWTFTVTGSLNSYTKTVKISATRTSLVTVTSWLEI